jgi:hypothetical protein
MARRVIPRLSTRSGGARYDRIETMPPERSNAPVELPHDGYLTSAASAARRGTACAFLPDRARRLCLVLIAVAAGSVSALSSSPAFAGKALHREHSAPALDRRHARLTRPVHARVAHARRVRGSVNTRPVAATHAGVPPLMNTAWDDAVLSPSVLGAIRDAARDTGIDPNLLMALAWRESRFDPRARNRHSTADGLLQFTSGAWLQAVRSYGAQNGAEAYAAAIHKERSGELTVHGQRLRSAILKLRGDPVLSVRLAAQTMEQHRAAMRTWLGRNVTPTDLYLLHVLGPSGSARFLAALAQRPSASSLEVADGRLLRNAGLLAQDSRPMSVASTYAAIRAMLDAQRARAEPLLAASDKTADAAAQRR